MKKTVLIPSYNVESFEKGMNRLVRRSDRIGGNVAFKEVGQELKSIEVNEESYDLMYYIYEIEGTAPKIEGYEVVAMLERHGELNLVNHINKEIKLPESLQNQKNYCDHCKSNRQRKYLFILKENDSENIIQVGRACLKDYIGHVSPEAIANWFETFDHIEEEYTKSIENFSYSNDVYLNVMDVIAFSSYFTDKRGYVKTSFHTEDNPSTKEITDRNIRSEEEITKDELIELGYYEKAENVIDWIRSLDSKNDYSINLKVLISEEMVSIKKTGFLASAYNSYNSDNSRSKYKNEFKVNLQDSEYVGVVKERKDFELTLNNTFTFSTIYGIMHIYQFLNESNDVIIWKTSNDLLIDGEEVSKGDKVTIKGTIKEHSKFRGIKQTVLTRCKVLSKNI